MSKKFEFSDDCKLLQDEGTAHVLEVMRKFAAGEPGRINDRTFRCCIDYLQFRAVLDARMFQLEHGLGQGEQGDTPDFLAMIESKEEQIIDARVELPGS